MKTKNLALFLILIANSIFAQIPDTAISIEDKEFNEYFLNKENIPTVKGKILNLQKEDFEKTTINYAIVTPFEEFQIEKSCTPNLDGSFELELDYPFPYQQIFLSVGKAFFTGIYVNKNLYIELDANKLKSSACIKYSGTDGSLNEYLNKYISYESKKQLKVKKAISSLMKDKEMDYTRFIFEYDSLYAILKTINESFIKKNPSKYSWLIENEWQSEYYGNLCQKHWGEEMDKELFEKVKNHKAYLTSNYSMLFYNYFYKYLERKVISHFPVKLLSYRSFSKLQPSEKIIMDSIDFFYQKYLEKIPYDTAKVRALGNQAFQFLIDTITVDRINKFTHFLDTVFEPSKADFLKIKIHSKDPKSQKLQTEAVLTTIRTDWCKNIIREQYDKNLEKLASIEKILNNSKPLNTDNLFGKPISVMPFGAKLYKVDTLESETLLANIKSSFKNKALIIDFWATWCAPCLHEMPYSKKLQDEVTDLPVEFIYLCTSKGSDIEQWKARIAEFEIGGTHIFVKQDIEIELMTLFSVSGFPSYVFIDSKGNYQAGAINRMSRLDKTKLTELIIK